MKLESILAPVLAALAAGALAQPAPTVGIAYPLAVQRGQTADVNLYGANLDGASALLFSGDPGLSAEVPPPSGPGVDLVFSGDGIRREREDARVLTTKVSAAPDAPLGERELRALTPAGVSAPVRFFVDDLPQIYEDASNVSMEKAQSIALPVAINNAIRNAAESDWYKFPAKKGERLIFDVQAFRIGSSLDSTLAVRDAGGRELARNEDHAGLDSLIDFAVPEDGDYYLEIRDLRYTGGGNHYYRIRAGRLPYLDAMFPFGARRGDSLEIALVGRNIEGAEKVRLRLDPGAALGTREIRATTALGVSNPLPFDVNDARNFVEVEPNALIGEANDAGAAPVVVNGRIAEAGEIDVFKIRAAKNRRLAFECFAARFGSKLDAVVELTDAEGKVLARNDDAAGADSRFEYAKFPEDGDYFVRVRDLLDRGGDRFGYRLNVYEPPANFTARFHPESPSISTGGHAVVRVEIDKTPGLFTAHEVRVEGLPEGVTAEPLLIPGDHPPSGWIALSAAPDARPGATPIRLVVSGVIDGALTTRVASPVVRTGDVLNPAGDRPLRESFLVVKDAAPFSIEPITLTAHAAQGQNARVDLSIRRAPGFDGPIRIRHAGFSYGRESIDRSLTMGEIVVPPGETFVSANMNARLDAEVGTRPVYFVGRATIGGVEREEPSPTVPTSVYETPFMLSSPLAKVALTALPEGSTSAAGEATLQVFAARRGLFTQPIALSVEGLPEGVSAEIPPIGPDDAEIKIVLRASDKAPTDAPAKISIVGRATANGRDFEQRTGEIVLDIDKPAEVAEAATAKEE